MLGINEDIGNRNTFVVMNLPLDDPYQIDTAVKKTFIYRGVVLPVVN